MSLLRKTTNRAEAASAPALQARAKPPFSSRRTTVIRSPKSASIAGVSSSEASSTTITSKSEVSDRASSVVRQRRVSAAWLYTGTITEQAGSAMPSQAQGGLNSVADLPVARGEPPGARRLHLPDRPLASLDLVFEVPDRACGRSIAGRDDVQNLLVALQQLPVGVGQHLLELALAVGAGDGVHFGNRTARDLRVTP